MWWLPALEQRSAHRSQWNPWLEGLNFPPKKRRIKYVYSLSCFPLNILTVSITLSLSPLPLFFSLLAFSKDLSDKISLSKQEWLSISASMEFVVLDLVKNNRTHALISEFRKNHHSALGFCIYFLDKHVSFWRTRKHLHLHPSKYLAAHGSLKGLKVVESQIFLFWLSLSAPERGLVVVKRHWRFDLSLIISKSLRNIFYLHDALVM